MRKCRDVLDYCCCVYSVERVGKFLYFWDKKGLEGFSGEQRHKLFSRVVGISMVKG